MAQILDLKNKRQNKYAESDDVEFSLPEQDKTEKSKLPIEALIARSLNRRILEDQETISWAGPLSLHHPNVKNIVIAAAIFFAIAALMQIFDGNLITTIFFALIGAVVLIHAGKKPREGEIEINPAAAVIDGKLYRYRDIRSFWIEYDLNLGIKELSLQPKKWHSSYVKIPITDQNPVQIRAYLLQFLPEEEHKDTLADVLARKLGI